MYYITISPQNRTLGEIVSLGNEYHLLVAQNIYKFLKNSYLIIIFSV